MANVKLPPRQKMINMMYLVLTAMLAMNVSKEVLDAFAVLDADLVRSEQAHVQRSQVEYAVFADAAQKFPDRYRSLNEQAQVVRLSADSLVAHIERIKLNALAEAEGRTTSELIGKNAEGRDSLMSLMHIEAKDDRDVITRTLVGSEPAEPKDGEGSAKEIKRRIGEFRDQLKNLSAAQSPELAASLDMLFMLDGGTDASGTWNNWESLNFYEVPLAAGIAHLSKLQADIRGAENDVVKQLYRSATNEVHVMSNVASAVIPRSTVVMVGDDFEADVFLAAYDEKNSARIALNGSGDLPVGSDGKGRLRLKATSVGEHTATGTIHCQGPKGLEEYPYSVTYQVMAPLLVASPTKMNVLYRGVENPLSFSVPGVTPENVRPVIDNGSVYRKGKEWFAKVNKTGKAHLSASATMPDGSSRTIGPIEFRAKDLPTPVAYVMGLTSTDTKTQANKLSVANRLIVKLGDGCEYDEPFKVTRMTVTLIRSGNASPHTVNSGTFDDETMKILKSLRTGDRIYFEEIKAQLANGEGRTYDVAPIGLKVIR